MSIVCVSRDYYDIVNTLTKDKVKLNSLCIVPFAVLFLVSN